MNPTGYSERNISTIVATRIRDLRMALKMSQASLAEKAGLERTAISKIEGGMRNVSSVELMRLADAFGVAEVSLLQDASGGDPEAWLLGNLPHSEPSTIPILGILREAATLRSLLRFGSTGGLQWIPFPFPKTYEDAIRQGQFAAELERKRIGLQGAPIADIVGLIENQGIAVLGCALATNTSGISVPSGELGPAIIINNSLDLHRFHFALCHEYGHFVLGDITDVHKSDSENIRALLEVRANIFAGAFLFPGTGLSEGVTGIESMVNGSTSGNVFSAANDPNSAVYQVNIRPERSCPVTPRQVALLSHRFGVSAELIIYRLKDLQVLKPRDIDALLEVLPHICDINQKFALYGNSLSDGRTRTNVQAFLMRLALEAYEAEVISTGRLRDICRLANYPADDIVDLVSAINP
jgi:Zn-dependent peptidase ImmA (M78 family)/DNA-binding XRE family transcriptional regulator